jgi:Transposase.
MPVELLSKSERAKLSQFPEEIPREDLRRHFTLSEEDRDAAGRLYGGANPLGFALALSALRYLGFFPPDLTDAPEEAVRRGRSDWGPSRCARRVRHASAN